MQAYTRVQGNTLTPLWEGSLLLSSIQPAVCQLIAIPFKQHLSLRILSYLMEFVQSANRAQHCPQGHATHRACICICLEVRNG